MKRVTSLCTIWNLFMYENKKQTIEKELFSPGTETKLTAELIPGASNPLMNLTKTQKLPFWNEISVEEHIGQRTKGSKSAANGPAP